jgi:glycosyltransferase involved in cell wall biosynthesis
MKKYKVALIHNIISPYRIPLFEKIAEHPSVDLCVYFTAISEANREWTVKLSDKFKYKILSCFTLKYRGKDLFSYHINPSIIQELVRNDYDVVIAGGYASFATQISLFLSKLRNIPFILWSGSTINEPSLLRKISLPLVKFIIRHSDAFIAYGTRAKEYLEYLGASSEKVFIAYNTVDTDFFMQRCSQLKAQKSELKDKIGIKTKKVVLYVGQLIERKNVKTLIKAYSKLKDELDVALLIVGDGPQKNELKNLCIEDNINDVFFVGFKQREELPQYYVMSDLFVLPSTQEVWGLVLNEAMASGLPVITTNKVGASVDLIKNGENGYVVESGNTEQLYKVTKKILSDPELEERMGEKSKRIIEKGFTYENMVDGFRSALNLVHKNKTEIYRG